MMEKINQTLPENQKNEIKINKIEEVESEKIKSFDQNIIPFTNDINQNVDQLISTKKNGHSSSQEDNSPLLIGENIYNKEYFEDKEPVFDYLIQIHYSKYFNIPYFIFSNTLHLYFPRKKIENNKVKLSEIETPPFTIGPGCKLN